MTDEQLVRALHSVGMAAFVRHLALFESGLPAEDAAEQLHLIDKWALTASRTRVNYARSILRAGRRADALQLIASANRVDNAVRDAARSLLQTG